MSRPRRQRPNGSVEPLESRVLLTTFSVTSINNAGNGSLRAAVAAANSSPGADIIEFSGGVFTDGTPDTILLTTGRMAITDDLEIRGPGASLLTISAGGASQLFFVNGAATDVSIDGLTLTGGTANGTTFNTESGGAIFNNNSALIVTNCLLTGNSANVDGGALFNLSGTMAVSRSTFADNSAARGGAGMASNGLLTVDDSSFSGNDAQYGGAIVIGTQGTLNLSASTFADNYAGIDGPGVFNYFGAITISDSTFTDNVGASGGPVTSWGTALIVGSTFSGNSSVFGGAIANSEGGNMIVANSTFDGNLATRDGGAVFNGPGGSTLTLFNSTMTGNSAGLIGGAVSNIRGSTMRIIGSTMSGNDSNWGGGIANIDGSTLTVVNSTVTGNVSQASGGGIINLGTLTVTNSTIVLNRSNNDGVSLGAGGAIHTVEDGGYSTRLNNTIVAGNRRGPVGNDAFNDLFGQNVAIESANNLISDPQSAGGLLHGTNGNIVGQAGSGGSRVRLPVGQVIDVTLSDNGGPTMTHALVAGSLAINAGSNALAVNATGFPLTTDQRGVGFPRVNNGTVDIGAYER